MQLAQETWNLGSLFSHANILNYIPQHEPPLQLSYIHFNTKNIIFLFSFFLMLRAFRIQEKKERKKKEEERCPWQQSTE